MSQNPFDALGGGGFDMGALLEQAQQMQQQMMDAQQRLNDAEVSGSAGGGSVSVTVNGVGEVRAVTIAPGTFDGSSAEDLGDLSDLIVAAYRDAKSKADAMAAEAIGPLAGGLGGGMPGLG